MAMVMQGVLLTGHGGPEMLHYRQDVPRPTPGPGEVLVRLRAAAVNNTDIATRTAWYAPAPTDGADQADTPRIVTFSKRTIDFPRIQGAGGAGVIAAVGPGVPGDRVGQVVVVDPYLRDLTLPPPAQLSVFMGSGCDGCFADYVTVRSENALAIRAPMTFAELACLPVAYQTAQEMVTRGRIGPGDKVVVTGASGGVGFANLQLARLHGASVLAVAGADKHAALRELGADQVIGRDADVSAAAEALWGERPVDVVLDVAGGPAFGNLLHSLRRGGRLVCAGAIAGAMADIDLRVVIYRDLEILGVGTSQPQVMQALLDQAETGALHPVISHVLPLADLARAQALFQAKSHVGKIVIDIHRAADTALPQPLEG